MILARVITTVEEQLNLIVSLRVPIHLLLALKAENDLIRYFDISPSG
jgi:hypothetical protein